MNQKINIKINAKTKIFLKSFFLLAIFAFSLQAVAIWQAPSAAPTGGNVATPINSGGDLQGKSGGLSVGFFQSNGTSTLNGSVSLGSTIKISGGSPGTGKVLRSDASGLASWVDVSNLGVMTNALANGRIFVGNGSGVATAVSMSGDATLANTGDLTIANNAITTGKILDGTIANADIADATIIATTKLSATGTKNNTTFLRGDNTWATPAGGGGVSGPITGSGLTMSAGKLLGRSSLGTGSVEEITVGTGLSLFNGTLMAIGAQWSGAGNTTQTIFRTGNVVLGQTDSPGIRLSVEGKVKAQEFCLSGSNPTGGCISTWPAGGGGGGGTVGPGTINRIAKFTSSTVVGNSQIFDNGVNVGIGADSMYAKFGVAGGMVIGSSFMSSSTPNGSLSISGGLGIGVIGSTLKLEVVDNGPGVLEMGRFYNQRSTTANTGAQVTFMTNSNAGATRVAGIAGIITDTSSNYKGAMTFYTSNGYQIVEQMRINHLGYVGIGKADPSQKLDVVGYIKASSGFCIDASCINAWPGGGGATLPSGTTNQTLRHNGTNWVATSRLSFNDYGLLIVDTQSADQSTSLQLRGGGTMKWDIMTYPSLGDNNRFSIRNAQSREKLTVLQDGKVGINVENSTNITHTLTVNGNAWVTGGSWSGSDIRWKKNIVSLENSLDKVIKMNPVRYNWRSEEFPDMQFDKTPQIGFIAQEIENIVPEVISTDGDGYKGISYDKIVPVLTKAIQELKLENDTLKARIEILEEKLR